jgi:hypothetical protein
MIIRRPRRIKAGPLFLVSVVANNCDVKPPASLVVNFQSYTISAAAFRVFSFSNLVLGY